MALVDDHHDATGPEHRFTGVAFRGAPWDLSHLDPFVVPVDLGCSTVTVVVLFSCHCFTHARANDPRDLIPLEEQYRSGIERRVLNPERYRLSREFLPRLIRELPTQLIRATDRGNFLISEETDSEGRLVRYAVFFGAKKDERRKRRVMLRVESAYPVEALTRRQRESKKVRFHVLVRTIHDGKQIRP